MIQRSRFVLLFVLILLLIAVGATAFALLYDPEYVKQLALRQVEQALGRKIEVGRARFEIFPRLRLELSQVVVREADREQVFFSADRLDLVLRALPLLQQKVVGKYLTVEHPRVTLRRDPAGQWNFLPPVPSSAGQVPDEGHALGLFLLVSETVLMNGEVTVIDEFRSDGVRSLHLGALDLVVMVDREGRRADLRLSSTLRNARGASALILDGTLRQAQPSVQMASEDLSRISPAVLFEGEADAINLSLPQFVEFFGPRPAPPQLPQAATVRGHLTLRPGVAGYDMMLSEMSAKVEDLLLSGQASLSGLMTAQPTFSLTVGTPMLRIEDVLSRVPEEWVPSPLRSRLVESNLTGLVQVVSATVSGAVVPESRLSVNGEFRVTEVRAPEGEGRQPLREVAATIFLEPDRVRVADVTGYYGPLHVSGGRAIVSYLEPGPWLEMEVAGDMMAAELVGSLASSGQTGPVWDALQALQEVQGGTLVTFRLVGPLNQTDELRFVEGEIVIQDGAFRTQVLPVPIAGLTGQIRFSDKGAEFERIRGQLGTSAFEVQGAIKAGQSAQFQDLIVRARGEAEDLMRFFPSGTFKASTLQGVVGATVTFSGPMTNPRMKGALDLRTIGFAMPGVFEKPLGTRTFVEFDGALGGKSNLVMDRVDLVFPPFRLTGKGAVRFGKSLRFHASLVSGPIAISGLPQGVLLGNLKDGILEVTLDIKGRGGNWRAWETKGWVAVTDGVLMTDGVESPLTNLFLRVQLVKDGAELKRLAFRIGDSDIRLSGLVRNLNRTPTMTLKAESSILDLGLIIPHDARSPIRDVLEELAATSRVVGTFEINRGRYKDIKVNDLTGRINIAKGVVDLDRITGEAEDGQLAGRVVVHLPPRKAADVEVAFRVQRFPFEKALDLAGDDRRMITGAITAKGNVRGNGENPRGVLPTISGRVDFEIEGGRIQKGTIVPKIISLLNLPNLLQGKIDLTKDGFPFDQVTGSFSIRDGLVTERNLVVDSPVMKMSAAGNYDLASNHLDVIVVTSPLGSYSQLLKSIPLFGRLLKGDRQGLDTALFRVAGPIQDPTVTYLPVRSLTTGLLGVAELAYDVLKNAVMLPADLVMPDNDATSGTPSENPVPRGTLEESP